MKEPVWVLPETAIAAHQVLIAEHGGLSGIRDQALLDSALARPQQLFAYGELERRGLDREAKNGWGRVLSRADSINSRSYPEGCKWGHSEVGTAGAGSAGLHRVAAKRHHVAKPQRGKPQKGRRP